VRALRGYDQQEIVVDPDLLNDLTDEILRRRTIDRHPAKRAHQSAERPAEQASLADEAGASATGVNCTQEY